MPAGIPYPAPLGPAVSPLIATRRRLQESDSQFQGRVPPTTQEHEQASKGAGASIAGDEALSEREIQKESRGSSSGSYTKYPYPEIMDGDTK